MLSRLPPPHTHEPGTYTLLLHMPLVLPACLWDPTDGLVALSWSNSTGDWHDALWVKQASPPSTAPVQLCLDNTGRLAVSLTDAPKTTVNLLYNGTGAVQASGVFFGAYLLDNGNFVLFSPTCDKLAETGAVDATSVQTPPCLRPTPITQGGHQKRGLMGLSSHTTAC